MQYSPGTSGEGGFSQLGGKFYPLPPVKFFTEKSPDCLSRPSHLFISQVADDLSLGTQKLETVSHTSPYFLRF